jgi:aryl-alcohol dehydrogenase-like predicted oxidoreductase
MALYPSEGCAVRYGLVKLGSPALRWDRNDENEGETHMRYRRLGRTGWQVSEIGFGAWAIGADWGKVDDADAVAALNRALDLGVNFIDTADVYGDGRSEQLIGRVLKQRGDTTTVVATKAGRRLSPHRAEGYTATALAEFVERSLRNLGVEAIDLLQLHCPPTAVYYMPEIFGALDDLVQAGKLKHYGVSVEKVEEAIKAIEYPNVKSVQIIYNIFRQRPADLFFDLAQQRDVAVIVRVPLASGLLTGKFRRDTAFDAGDHRLYNRHGEAFDVGETFAGVPYEAGLDMVEELRPLVPEGATLAQYALRWILMADAVSTTIPGAKNAGQAEANIRAADLPALSETEMDRLQALYETRIKELVHQRW